MTDTERSAKQRSRKRLLIAGFFVFAAIAASTQLNKGQGAVEEVEEEPVVTDNRIETIFMPLARTTVDLPLKAEGSGGSITDWGGVPVVLSQSGEFFTIEDGEAKVLALDPPVNNVDAYTAYVASIDDRDATEYWFRYNDLFYSEDLGGRLFVSHSHWDTENNCATSVVSAIVAGPSPEVPQGNWEQIYKTSPCLTISPYGPPMQTQLAAGRMAVTEDGKLLMTSGDHGKDGLHTELMAAQRDDHDYGKVLEIDIETGTSRHLSTGHSNPQGIAIDNDGAIWVAEHGRRGGDELNLILEGRNYGWPVTSLGTRYNKLALPTIIENGVHSEGYEPPVFAWLPSLAPGDLVLIEGFDPLWDGDLLMGTLADQSLVRIRLRDGRVLFAENIPLGHRVRKIQMMSDGRIAIFTDSRTVEFLSVGKADFAYETAMRFVQEVNVSDSERAQLKATIDACTQCHSFGQFSSDLPALGSVFGKPFSESIAASHTGGETVWTAEALKSYLDDPQSFAPDGAMPDPMLERGPLLDNLVLLLNVLAKNPQ